ncbi:MAG: acyl carrier protein [Bacteroidales bacterium]|nr:acyl carrier protein [Bacteroidales bacterium]
MDKATILTELKSVFKEIKKCIDTDSISEDTRLVEDLGLDSLTILLLSFAIEKKFGFKFDGPVKFATVGEVVDYVEKMTL